MKQALDGVVIVPWALMLDKWRSGVFDGDIDESNLNSSWWSLREEYIRELILVMKGQKIILIQGQNIIYLVILLTLDII